MKLNLIIYICVLSGMTSALAQTEIGTFKTTGGLNTRTTAYTDSGLGVGTKMPEGKAEIRYCPPLRNDYTGLVVTRVNCDFSRNMTGNLELNTVPPVLAETDNQANGGGSLISLIPHYYTSTTPLGFPIYTFNNKSAPLVWFKQHNPVFPGGSGSAEDVTRFIVTPGGRAGFNVANPRGGIDVVTGEKNIPAAIFGVRAQRPSFTIAGNPVQQQYTQHVEVVPHCTLGSYNGITREKDLGLFFTDGLGNEGSNQNGALVIGPWRSDGVGAGLRMEPNGNLLIKGSVEAQGKITCNGFVSKPKWWPDYVFEKDYKLMPMDSVSLFIQQYRHLPGMPSQEKIISEGQDIAHIQQLQQEKIEELTLYLIIKEKEIAEMRKKLNDIEDKLFGVGSTMK